MTDLAVYRPSNAVEVASTCDSVEAWAETCDSIPQLRHVALKLAAYNQYLESTSTQGLAMVTATLRRLEARIGALDTPQQGRRSDQLPHRDEEVQIHDQTRSDFRRMAEHPGVVDEVIAESTDAEPPSRRKVMDRIRATRWQIEQSETPEATPTPPKPRRGSFTKTATNAGWDLRKAVDRVKRLADDDRYPTHRDKVAPHIRSELAYAVEVCQDLLDELDTSPQQGQ